MKWNENSCGNGNHGLQCITAKCSKYDRHGHPRRK